MHQLGEDGRFLTESLEDNVQHGCEEDVEQQRGIIRGYIIQSSKYLVKTRSSVVCRVVPLLLTSGRRLMLLLLGRPVETVAASSDRGVLSA